MAPILPKLIVKHGDRLKRWQTINFLIQGAEIIQSDCLLHPLLQLLHILFKHLNRAFNILGLLSSIFHLALDF